METGIFQMIDTPVLLFVLVAFPFFYVLDHLCRAISRRAVDYRGRHGRRTDRRCLDVDHADAI